MRPHLTRKGRRWSSGNFGIREYLDFVADVRRSLSEDESAEAMVSESDRERLSRSLLRLRAGLGLGPVIRTAQVPPEPEAPRQSSSPIVMPQREHEFSSPGFFARVRQWLRSPGGFVTLGAAAALALATWYVATGSKTSSVAEPEFAFLGSTTGTTTRGPHCPVDTEPRSRALDGGGRAIWCEQTTPDVRRIRAPYFELDTDGRLALIGRYEGEQRAGAFVIFETVAGAMQTRLMCFRQGSRVASTECEVK